MALVDPHTLPEAVRNGYGPLDLQRILRTDSPSNGVLLVWFLDGTHHRWEYGGEPGHRRWYLVGGDHVRQ